MIMNLVLYVLFIINIHELNDYCNFLLTSNNNFYVHYVIITKTELGFKLKLQRAKNLATLLFVK